MATIENLIKVKKRKELSIDLLTEFNSKQNTHIHAVNMVKDIFNVLGDALCEKSFDVGGETDNDKCRSLRVIAKLQDTIYENIFHKYRTEINDFRDYIKQLKRDNYEFPRVDKVYELIYKTINDITFKSSTSYYGKTFKFDINQTFLKSDNLANLLDTISLFDYPNVESIMESLGFVIMPCEFLSEEAYKVDKKYSTSTIKNNRDNFINIVKELYGDSYDIYVLAPIKFLNLMKWAKCKDINKKVVFAKSLANISLTINMNMPLFRSVFDTLEVLTNKVDNVDKRIGNVEKQIDGIERRVDILENKVGIIEETVDTKLTFVKSNISILQDQLSTFRTEMQAKIDDLIQINKNQSTRIASLEIWRLVCETDPYIFAKSKTSNDCISGFAWGPEFTQEVVKSLGLKTYSTSHPNFKDVPLKFNLL